MAKKLADLSFAGCGFLGLFHVGSLAAFRKYQVSVNHCLGASSGALVACAAAGGLETVWVEEKFRSTVKRMQKLRFGAFSPEFDLSRIFKEELIGELPEDICNIVNNRLHISLTSSSMQNVVVSSFASREDLVDALICSCFIPVFSGNNLHQYLGKKYLDGGLTNQFPVLDEKTIKISPFSGKFKDVSPEDKSMLSLTIARENMYLSKMNLIRAKHAVSYLDDEQLDYYYKLGFNQTELFINNKLLK